MKIALIGAESTGKTELALALAERLNESTGLRCVAVPEFLRQWCVDTGRTPRADEQAAIADEQARRIESACATHDVVIADTTPLMTAVYSELLFDDRTLYPMAIAFQHRFRLNLLMALDLPWVADGMQRDGEHVRAPVDQAVRTALIDAGIAWHVIAGQGPDRGNVALDVIGAALRGKRLPRSGLFTRLQQRNAGRSAGQWACTDCDVPECEHLSMAPSASRGR